MLTITKRPLTEDEIAGVQPRPRSAWQVAEGWFVIFLGPFFLLMLLFLFINRYVKVSSRTELIASVGILAISAVLTEVIRRRLSKPHGPAVNETLEAEVLHIRTSRALMREDPDDLGRSFYVEIETEPARCLFLWGHQLDELFEEGLFPNTEFNLTRLAGVGEHLDVELLGEPFKPERTLQAFTRQRLRANQAQVDGDIIASPIDAILE